MINMVLSAQKFYFFPRDKFLYLAILDFSWGAFKFDLLFYFRKS